MSDERTALLTLSLAPGIGPRRIRTLLDAFGTAAQALEAAERDLVALPGLGTKAARAITDARSSDAAARELERCRRLDVTVIAASDAGYPASLAAIYDPPPVLFVRGTLPKELCAEPHDLRAVAIVGSRDASPYALRVARDLGRDLAAGGLVVVSGLALGVDAAAHEGVLEASGGAAVAVLGCGVDRPYPLSNRTLARRIVDDGGALVSEHPPGTAPKPGHFPGRNRIINGLAKGVVVVEAKAKSGALITSDFALEEGRTVFAVPGHAGDPRAAGTLELLRAGAVLTEGAPDVLREFGWDGLRAGAVPAAAASVGSVPQPESAVPAELRDVVRAIAAHEAPLLDDLMLATGRSASDLLTALAMLELDGVVRASPAGRFELVPGGSVNRS